MFNIKFLFSLVIFVSSATIGYASEGSSISSKVLVGYEKSELMDAMPHVKFDGDAPKFSQGFMDELRQKISSLGEIKNLNIEVVAHTDNTRLGAASRAKWGSNIGLSKIRAQNALEEIKSRVDIAGATYSSKGVGASEPVVANDNEANRERNRRAEINITYDKPLYKLVKKDPVPSVAPIVSSPELQESQTEKVKNALAVKDGDEDANTLEEALTAVDQNYSLIKKNKFSLQYGYSFNYSSSDSILLSSSGTARLPLNVSKDSRYTHSSSLSLSYGLKNNLTLGVSLPFVSSTRVGSISQSKVEDDGIGDMSLSIRWQPWPTRLGKTNTTFSGSISLPTGTNPYKIDTENSIATGSGTYSMGFGVNFNKSIDPVVAYGGFSIGRAIDITNLNQVRGDGRFLKSIRPKPSFSYSMGIGYALSYGVSLNMGFQHSFGSRTVLEFSDLTRDETNTQTTDFESIGGHSATFNVSAGFRTSPGTVMSVNLGMGLTRDSPDFLLGFSLPFSIKGFKKYFDGE